MAPTIRATNPKITNEIGTIILYLFLLQRGESNKKIKNQGNIV
ncbi:Hypothetical protein Ccan_22910 [Capnocytophaga canimorsus Cc5]|uniref:Uncharacterized protein n=1 Tax=Capnocytophaga canimorsus (strain 5) TaxID=860228 RepID=F9YVH2_CAPCC|nr:Hypothetical protein Ccan_22910 [Capnocytophaga canimorsus Cc5]